MIRLRYSTDPPRQAYLADEDVQLYGRQTPSYVQQHEPPPNAGVCVSVVAQELRQLVRS